jgi:hypothetical protein
MPNKVKLPPLTTPPDIEAIHWYELDELIIWKDNYNEGDVGSIAGSIRRFGFANDPRVWQGANVRGGNHTVMALRQIKAEGPRAGDLHYPPARVRVEGDQWFIACADISYLSEDDADFFAVSDNRQAQRASQDDKKLLEYLSAMDESTLFASGYDEDDIDYLTKLTTPYVSGGFDKPPEEAFETFMGSTIKQITIYFEPQGYIDAVSKFNRIMRAEGLESNTEVVLHILDYYFANVQVAEEQDADSEFEAAAD